MTNTDAPYHLLTTLLRERFQVPQDRMTGQSTFQELDLDSIAVIEVLVILSEQLGVEMDDALARPGTTLAQAAALLTGAAPDLA